MKQVALFSFSSSFSSLSLVLRLPSLVAVMKDERQAVDEVVLHLPSSLPRDRFRCYQDLNRCECPQYPAAAAAASVDVCGAPGEGFLAIGIDPALLFVQ